MSSFVKRVEELTHDQRTAIERVGFGNLLHVHHHSLRKNLLVEWMERWDSDKRAFILHDKELTITNIDVALILGLRTIGNPVCLSEEDPISELEKEYGATSRSRKISIITLEQRLESLGEIANEDFVRTFLLFIFGTLLFPNSNAKVDSRYLSLLKDLDAVSEFAWGMSVVEDLYNWLSKRKEEQTKSIEGCLILLQIWSYEHIDIGRPNLLSGSLDFPRACRWESSRCNSPRHWFTTKFNELDENQVTWKLQPTTTELSIEIIRELLVEVAVGDKIPSKTTTTTMKDVPSKIFSRNIAVLDEEPERVVRRGKDEQQAGVPENSGQSSEISSLIEETNREVLSTRTRSTAFVTMGLPPKSLKQHAALDKEAAIDVRRSKTTTQDDIREDSRQSDVSAMTEDYTECSSSYGLQEGQIAEISQCLKVKCDLNEVDELKRKNDMLEEVVAKLRKENADLREDNQRLRTSPPPDRIERRIHQMYDEIQADLDLYGLR
ncbi:hypothetical protein SOVF_052160 [Spinacia oleracea]|nr:hypothetical protein SOVF_052160 [Spinacia oleracea]